MMEGSIYLWLCGTNWLRPDFLYSLVYDNFFQRSNVGGRNKNKNKMSQNKDITWSNDKFSLQKINVSYSPCCLNLDHLKLNKLYNNAFNLLKI